MSSARIILLWEDSQTDMCTKEQRLRVPALPLLHEACEEYPRLTAILR